MYISCILHIITEVSFNSRGEGFRPHYAKLGQLRARIHSRVHVMALTATATKSIKESIFKSLCLPPETKTIIRQANRENLRYMVTRVKAGSMEPLRWLLDTVMTKQQDCPKTIVFCRNVKTVALAFSFFVTHMGDELYVGEPVWENRLVAMYHRSTHPVNKEYVQQEFPKEQSVIRILFATIAFGMGVDIPDIRQVVHFGCARSLEAYAQETGRGGRDGKRTDAIMLYHSQNLSKVQSADSMRAFVKEKSCRRVHLLEYFALQPAPDIEVPSAVSGCQCCDNCRSDCDCGSCVDFPCIETVSDNELAEVVADPLSQSISPEEEYLIRGNLMDYYESLSESSEPGLLSPTLLHGFSRSVIDLIMSSVGSILCEDDLSTLTGIQDGSILTEIMELIREIVD